MVSFFCTPSDKVGLKATTTTTAKNRVQGHSAMMCPSFGAGYQTHSTTQKTLQVVFFVAVEISFVFNFLAIPTGPIIVVLVSLSPQSPPLILLSPPFSHSTLPLSLLPQSPPFIPSPSLTVPSPHLTPLPSLTVLSPYSTVPSLYLFSHSPLPISPSPLPLSLLSQSPPFIPSPTVPFPSPSPIPAPLPITKKSGGHFRKCLSLAIFVRIFSTCWAKHVLRRLAPLREFFFLERIPLLMLLAVMFAVSIPNRNSTPCQHSV